MILPLWRLTTEIPASFTSGGIWLTAREMLFCTLTAAISGSVPGLKKTDMVPDPALLAIERIYVIFSTPLMASSNGRSTGLATVSTLPPVLLTLTLTLGGAMSGNLVTGNCKKPTIPAMTRRMEITVASTGLFMIVLNILFLMVLHMLAPA